MSDFENPLAPKSDDGDVKKKLTNGKKWTIGLGVVGILVMIYLYSKSKSSSSSSTASTTAPNAAGISSTMAAEQSGASAQAQLDQQMLQNAMSTSSVLGTSPGYTTSGGAPSSGYNINPGGQMVTASGSGGGSSTGTTPSTSGGSGYVAPQYPSSPQYNYLTPQADTTLAAGTPLFGKTSSGQYVQVGTKGAPPGEFLNGSRRAAMGIGTQLYTAG